MNYFRSIKLRYVGKYYYLTVLLLTSMQVSATNGSNVIGFGHESLGLAGADIGYIRDTSAVGINPAGLTLIDNSRLDLHTGFTDAGSIKHTDMFDNNVTQANSPIPFGGFAIASRLNKKLVTGVGLLAQGGSGVEYKNINTAFNTKDNLRNLFSISKLSIGLGYQQSDNLSLGASLDLYYASLKQDVFPNTSIPAQSFYGYSLNNASTFSTAFRFGLQYQLTKNFLIGAAYVSPSNLDIEGADIHFNFSGLGLGSVKYNVDLSGLKQPQELGIGFSFLISDRFTLSMEVNWIDWSSAFNSSVLSATNPNNALAPSEITIDTNYDWRDQYVFSAGIIYHPNNHLTIRSGINYAKNPIPTENLTPLLPLIGERHVTLGIGYKPNKKWEINGTVVRGLPNTVTYTNNESIFGSNFTESYSGTLYLATLSLFW